MTALSNSVWPVDILPLIERLAAEKPIHQGLMAGYGVDPDQLINHWPGEWQAVSVAELETLAFSKRYDLAVIALHYDNKPDTNKAAATQTYHQHEAALTHISVQQFSAAITRLRDLLARRVLVLANTEFTPLLRSLGFSQIEQVSEHCIIWQFNILSYKQVPDWLNSKHWANPENWGKYRW